MGDTANGNVFAIMQCGQIGVVLRPLSLEELLRLNGT